MHADLAVRTPVTVTVSPEHPLLKSKFEVPDRPRFAVARPRLVDALSSRRDAPVILVVGPAGSGKTQLVASWVSDARMDAVVAWVTLDDDDQQTSTFWTYVVEALRRAGVPISASPPAGATVDRFFLVRLAAELSEQQLPVLLVLDGVSGLPGEQWAKDLELVLRHTCPQLRLALIGRWDPPLPLHRYRLAGRLTEVRSGDLAFTADEATELLTLHGIQLSAAGQASLLEHTEGWAAGLRLFAMALQGRDDADGLVGTITGNEATIAEYFVDEVLRLQPPDVRAFLLEISILDTFTPELAAAVTGRVDARRLLADLARQNAFVQPTTGSSTAYRIHRLFAELLHAQLLCEAPERTAQLHHRAAAWFAAEHHTVEAVSHELKVKDWGTAATIVVDHYAVGRLVLDGRAGRLGALLQHLPDDPDVAEVALVAAALALADGAVERCEYQLSRAQELVMRRGWEYSQALALADHILGVLLAAACDDHARVLQMSPVTEHALAQAPPDELARCPELRALTLAAKGLAQSSLGAIDAATVTLTEATTAAEGDCEYLRAGWLQHLAVIEAHRGRLRHAEKLAAEALDLADRCGLEAARRPVGAHLALAWVAMERYDVDAAGRHLRLADPKRHQGSDGLVLAAFALVKSRRLQAGGELRGALAALDQVATAADGPEPPEWLARDVVVARARLLVTMGRPDEALEAVRRFTEPPPEVVVLHAAALAARGEPEQAREMVRPVVGSATLAPPIAVEAWLTLATVAAQLGERDAARSALRHALRIAAPESQRRAVQEVWAQLRRLLRDDDELLEQYRALQGTAPAAAHRADRGPDPDGLVIVEALSRREMEVLQGMAAMLPTEEIAATLYVSVNTVKTHVRSILRKLSASRRNEAVRRARSLGLI